MVKKLDAIKIYEIAESGNTGRIYIAHGKSTLIAVTMIVVYAWMVYENENYESLCLW